MSLYLDFKTSALKYGKSKACFYDGHYYSYKEILNKIDSLAAYLKDVLHLHESVTVSLCLKNSLTSMLMMYACNKVGMIVNLINPNIAADQILYFDLMIKSRVLFIDKNLYLNNINTFKNIKGKLALVDSLNSSIIKQFIFLRKHKQCSGGIPFKFKNKVYKLSDDLVASSNDNKIAFTAPNEKFDERPYIACATNGSMHQAMINQSEIYIGYCENDLLLPDASMMSLALFNTYFHTPMMNKIIVCLDDTDDDKQFNRLLKNNKITLFCGDIGSYRRLFLQKDKLIGRFISCLKCAFIYNDTQRTYVNDLWKHKCLIAMKKVTMVSLLGCVETLGAFAACNIDEVNPAYFGKFLGDFKPHIISDKKKLKIGKLQILSKSLITGYYKSPNKSDKIIDETFGILTDFEGHLDIDNKLYLTGSKYNHMAYYHNASYLVNLKEMLMTIPGIKNLNLTVSVDMKNTMEFLVEADSKESNRITNQITDYLKTQLKNIDYKIKFKD